MFAWQIFAHKHLSTIQYIKSQNITMVAMLRHALQLQGADAYV